LVEPEFMAQRDPHARDAPVPGCVIASCFVFGLPFVLVGLGALYLGFLFALSLVNVYEYRPPNLPEFARPAASDELSNDEYCSGNRDNLDLGRLSPFAEFPLCRSMEFGTNRPFADIRSDLLASFKQRGWEIGLIPPGVVYATRGDHDVCISYWAGPPVIGRYMTVRSEYAEIRAKYDTLINVTVSNCRDGA
jgi:hypothetical protein